MAGSSLLAMPWAIHQAGFATGELLGSGGGGGREGVGLMRVTSNSPPCTPGIVIVLAMMGICFFTCNLVIKSGKGGTREWAGLGCTVLQSELHALTDSYNKQQQQQQPRPPQ